MRFTIFLALAAFCWTANAAQPNQDYQALLARCVPHASPVTMTALLRQESSFNRYAVNDNSAASSYAQPTTKAEAVALVSRLLAAGHNVDVGLGQINSANFYRLSFDWPQLFEPCKNLKAAAMILRECYARALHPFDTKQGALRAALSCYNTGNFKDGFSNGYVMQVAQNVGSSSGATMLPIPALEPSGPLPRVRQRARPTIRRNAPPVVLRSDAEKAADSPLFVSNSAMPSETQAHANEGKPKQMFVYTDPKAGDASNAENDEVTGDGKADAEATEKMDAAPKDSDDARASRKSEVGSR